MHHKNKQCIYLNMIISDRGPMHHKHKQSIYLNMIISERGRDHLVGHTWQTKIVEGRRYDIQMVGRRDTMKSSLRTIPSSRTYATSSPTCSA